MANLIVYQNLNFKASDSPTTLDFSTDLGVNSSRAIGLINLGPGRLDISIKYPGAAFETAFSISPRTAILGESFIGLDQMKIEHTGNDSGYVVPASPISKAIEFTTFPNPEVFFTTNYLSEFLLDGSTVNMAVDGTVPVEYSFTVAAGRRIRIARAFITIEDGNQAFNPGNFGAITGALSNGLEVSATPSGGSKQILETWTTNREIRNTMFDFDAQFRQDGAYVGRWSFFKAFAIRGLHLQEGDKFSVLVQDNLAGLNFLSFRIQGVLNFFPP